MRRRLTILLASILLLGLAACGSDDAPAPTGPVPAVVDLAPPAPPVGMSCADLDRTVKVAWQPADQDPDFVGIRLTRTAGGHTVVLVDEPQDIVRYVDTHPFAGVAVYAVSAVDAAGNESAAATMIHEFQDVSAPQPVIY